MHGIEYNFDELYGAGTSSIDLTAGTTYYFVITNNSGSSYFTMETQRNNYGYYDNSSPKNTSGSFSSLTNIAYSILGDYISSFVLPSGINSFEFTPSSNVDGSTLYFRGTGGITLELYPGSYYLNWNQIHETWNEVTSSWEAQII
jgi:hypothetical protein